MQVLGERSRTLFGSLLNIYLYQLGSGGSGCFEDGPVREVETGEGGLDFQLQVSEL